MIYGYARSSLKIRLACNSLEYQQQALEAAGAKKIYMDDSVGIKSERPEFNALMANIKSGDTLIITNLDRCVNSISQAYDLISRLLDKNITVNILNIGCIDPTPECGLMRSIVAAFAEFERNQISERTLLGKESARKNPRFRDGRPPKYTKKQAEEAVNLLKSYTYNDVAKMTGISKSTLVRMMNDSKKNG